MRLEVDEAEATEEARLVANEMDEAAANAAPPRLFMFEGDQEFVEALIRKYGKDDYQKMAKDTKLNPYQVALSRMCPNSSLQVRILVFVFFFCLCLNQVLKAVHEVL